MITIPGLYPDLAYHSPIRHTPTRALTYSGIKILVTETPENFIAPRTKKSEAMNFGSIVHALALDKGDKFQISPYSDYKTKDAREWRDEVIEQGDIPIKPADYAEAADMAKVIKRKIHVALDGAKYQTEVPFFWQEGETWCSGMADVWCEERSMVIDPKVTSRIHGEIARAHIYNQGWHLQSAWYRRGLEAIMPERAGRLVFANLLISPDEPYTSRLISVSEAWRHIGERECLRALRLFDQCMATDTWPGYPQEVEVLDAPVWAAMRAMDAEAQEDNEGSSD